MMKSLVRLNLSHNRIATLQYFKDTIHNGQQAPNLQFIDLNDNYISDMH